MPAAGRGTITFAVTAHVQDDAFHEIQLNGKQLVFAFMVATVLSVVIFLCGVFVGRGVRVDRGATDEAAAALVEAPTADAAPAKNPSGPVAAQRGADPRVAAPPPTVDDQSYVARLEKRDAPAEDLKPPPVPATPPSQPAAQTAKPNPAPAVRETKPVPSPVKASPAPVAAETASVAQPGPQGQGFVVQVAALNVRSEADAIVKRLASKGYAAFVQASTGGSPSVFRVRVGPFASRREADALAAKLQKEEQFKPWVTR